MPFGPFGRRAKKKTLIDQAADLAETALERVESAIEQARETAAPKVAEAREKAAPILAEAKSQAAEKAAVGAALAREKAAAGASLAAEQAATGKELASAKLAGLKHEPEPKRGRFKKFLLFSGLLAVGGLVFKTMRDRQASDNWQSSYVPPEPAPTPATPTSTPSPTDTMADPLTDPMPSDDAGGAGPDEALADAVESPHPVTTPDEPAEEVDVSEEKSNT
jgi:vacuolar-type H+-ATPase subunit H